MFWPHLLCVSRFFQAEDQEEGRDPHASPEAFDTLKSFRQVRFLFFRAAIPGFFVLLLDRSVCSRRSVVLTPVLVNSLDVLHDMGYLGVKYGRIGLVSN